MKRRLELASSALDCQFTFRVRWEPFLIHPHCPRDGIPVEGPVGGDLTNPRVQHLKETGKNLGIDFNFTCPVYPYTVPAHVLMEYAKEHDGGAKQNEVCDKLFRAYFTKGRQLEMRHLLKIAEDVGFDIADVKQYLEDVSHEEHVKTKAASWRKQGIQAIPFMLVNGQPSCSGAQDTETLVETIIKAAAKFPLGESQV
ncbi:hypothetical protein Btru_048667 [Bulinus truncatus]|nr:hypothetical protein Btru_048667 [Bulinus truncatus]